MLDVEERIYSVVDALVDGSPVRGNEKVVGSPKISQIRVDMVL